VIPTQQSERVPKTKNWKILMGVTLLIVVILAGVLLNREKDNQSNSEQFAGITQAVTFSPNSSINPTPCIDDSSCTLPEMPVGLH